MTPDYAKYSVEELLDAYNHIDKEQFAERVKVLEAELKKRGIHYWSTMSGTKLNQRNSRVAYI